MLSDGAQAVSSVPTAQSAYKAYFSDRVFSYVAYGALFFYGGTILLLLLWVCSSHVPNFRGVETNVIFGIDKILRNLPLYGDPAQAPFDIEQYTPLYYYVVTTVVRLLGFHSGDAYHITATARCISFLCLFGTLSFTFFLLRNFKVTSLQALATCSFILIATSPWLVLARPDGMLSLCLMAMTYLTVIAIQSQSPAIGWRFTLAALCAVGAITIKQNGVIGIVIIASFYALWREWRYVATPLLLAVPMLLISLNHEASGMISLNIIDGIRNGVNVSLALEKAYVPFWSQMATLVALFANAAVTYLNRSGHPGHKFLILSAICHFIFATVMALKDGAAIHYYNDFIVLASIVVAIDLKRVLPTRPLVDGGFSLLVVGAIYLSVFLTGWTANQIHVYFLKKRGDYFETRMPVAEFLQQNLSHTPMTFFISTDPVLNLLLPSKGLLPQIELATSAYSQGQINYVELARLLEQGKVRYLVLRAGETPRTLLGTDLTIFKHHLDIDKWSIYIYGPSVEMAR